MTTITENWARENRRDLSDYDRYANYLQTTNGAKTYLELAQKTLQGAAYSIGLTQFKDLHHSNKYAGTFCWLLTPNALRKEWSSLSTSLLYIDKCISILSWMLVPDAFMEMWQSLFAAEGESLARKSISAVRTSSDALLMSCSALSLFSSNPAIETVSSIGESTYDGSDLYLSGSDYLAASGLEDLATGDVKEVFAHSKNYYFLRVCRAVVSIAAAVFSLFLIAFSPQWGLVALTLSTVATMLSILRDTHKESGPYPVITFDHL